MNSIHRAYTRILFCGLLAVSSAVVLPAAAQPEADAPAEQNWLIIPSVGTYGRSAVHTDAIEAEIVAGRWTAPREGDSVTAPNGKQRKWERVAVKENAWLESPALRGGYAYWAVDSPVERVMMLVASGHSMVYVNGRPRTGDPYRTGFVRLPVLLRAGTNDLLFHCSRGGVRARLVEPAQGVMFHSGDRTLPDVITGESEPLWAGLIVINATREALSDCQIEATSDNGEVVSTPLPNIEPLSTRKIAVQMTPSVSAGDEKCAFNLALTRSDGGARSVIDTTELSLRIRKPADRHVRTFRSEIDGSVQYYAVTPRRAAAAVDSVDAASADNPDKAGVAGTPGDAPSEPPTPSALFVSLHGAGVEGRGQAACYAPKDWGTVVAPTNRRPFGFDWEDWGRLDAMEVIARAAARYDTDPRRTYLTGHSMGGHGVWHLGVTFPDRFAAIGPSAGWISFWSYTGAGRYENADAIEKILLRATSASDTLALSQNYVGSGVYILHGDRDDNVPVAQARTMVKHLAGYHRDFAYYERPGAGHWWGNACVDWPPMFDFFEQHVRPVAKDARRVRFATASPGVSARRDWVTIEAQQHSMQVSSVDVTYDPAKHEIIGTTDNIARLSFNLEAFELGERVAVTLDSQETVEIVWHWPGDELVRLARGDEGRWGSARRVPADAKGPHRCGPFKDAFRHRFMLVYGTRGDDDENAWAKAKARLDAETFWYRGNGSVDVVADTAFDADAEPNRSVIVYGNADTHAAWPALLGESPIRVSRGEVTIGEHTEKGPALACLFIRPRPGSDIASVGVVGGTGSAGMRLTDRLPYFVSGVAYPDWIVLGPECLEVGSKGVRGCGFFDNEWGVASDDTAWRTPADQPD